MTLTRRTEPGALAQYDPAKGIKKIAVLEMAEKHYRAAKNPDRIRDSIRKKLEAQAEFVDWWTTYGPGKNHGAGRGKKMTDQSSFSADEVAEQLGTRVKTISRWRQRTATDEAFERTCETQTARALKSLECETTAHVGQNTGDNEWFTPAEYIEAARSVLGAIDLDPASSAEANQVVKAATFYTSADSGLDKDKAWRGRVWMNPPYAQPLITQFCERLSQHVQQGDVTAAVVLVNNATETGWFRSLADVAGAVCFPEGRIRFWHPKKDTAAPLQGQAFLYCGPDAARFNETFSRFGVVWVKP